MNSDLLSETKISFSTLARREGVNPATVWRWAARGVRGVRLEHYLRAGRRFTTVEAFERFCQRTTEAADAPSGAPRSNRQREADILRAEQELAAAGI